MLVAMQLLLGEEALEGGVEAIAQKLLAVTYLSHTIIIILDIGYS